MVSMNNITFDTSKLAVMASCVNGGICVWNTVKQNNLVSTNMGINFEMH